jgi:hypothetical protein
MIMTRRLSSFVAALGLALVLAMPAHASILTFDVFDPDPGLLDGN